MTLLPDSPFTCYTMYKSYFFICLMSYKIECVSVFCHDDDVKVSSIMSGLKTRSLGLNTLGHYAPVNNCVSFQEIYME